VAVSANCQDVRPKRLVSSSETESASSVGSMSVRPRAACSASARSVGSGACPVIAPVSPRQKSTYSIPSTSTKWAPCASRTNTGKPPGHLRIQCMGTPSKRLARARPASSRERGRVSANRVSSRACSSAIRVVVATTLYSFVAGSGRSRSAASGGRVSTSDQGRP
jgi:hypothetical protein